MLLLLGGVVSLEIEDYRRTATISKKRKKKRKKKSMPSTIHNSRDFLWHLESGAVEVKIGRKHFTMFTHAYFPNFNKLWSLNENRFLLNELQQPSKKLCSLRLSWLNTNTDGLSTCSIVVFIKSLKGFANTIISVHIISKYLALMNKN